SVQETLPARRCQPSTSVDASAPEDSADLEVRDDDNRSCYGFGGNVPPSARIFALFKKFPNVLMRFWRSFSRAASSGSIELSRKIVYINFVWFCAIALASSVPWYILYGRPSRGACVYV